VNRVLRPGAQACFVVPNSEFFLLLKVERVYRDIGPGVFEGGLLRGVLRKLVLLLFNLLPLHYTYQFVFICRKGNR
jgi:hypothetical protein